MSFYNYREALDLAAKNGLDIDSPLQIEKAMITGLEQRWKHRLPRSYIQMIEDFGCLGIESIEIYGLTPSGFDAKSVPSVVFATESTRSRGEITSTMVEVRSSGYGPYFVIECAEMNELGEAPVYEIHERGYQEGMKKVADSFGEFLLSEVKMLISYR